MTSVRAARRARRVREGPGARPTVRSELMQLTLRCPRRRGREIQDVPGCRSCRAAAVWRPRPARASKCLRITISLLQDAIVIAQTTPLGCELVHNQGLNGRVAGCPAVVPERRYQGGSRACGSTQPSHPAAAKPQIAYGFVSRRRASLSVAPVALRFALVSRVVPGFWAHVRCEPGVAPRNRTCRHIRRPETSTGAGRDKSEGKSDPAQAAIT